MELLELLDEHPRCVLAVYAHPDDSDVSCGASLARWVSEGAEVHLVVCAAGDKGSSPEDCRDDELVIRRTAEVEAAAAVLGLSSVSILGRRDGEFENDLELRAALVRIMRARRPDALVCPDPSAVFFGEHYYNHRDHRVVGWAALDAASPAAASKRYFPEAGRAHQVRIALLSGSLEPNVAVDVSSTIDRKADAVMCHRSQLEAGTELSRATFHERAEQAGRLAGVRCAELFRRIVVGV